MIKYLCFIVPLFFSLIAYASSGRTDSNGCHTSKSEGFHCHGSGAVSKDSSGNYTYGTDYRYNELKATPVFGLQYNNFNGSLILSSGGLIIDASYKLYIGEYFYLSPNISLFPSDIDLERFVAVSGVYYGASAGIDIPLDKIVKLNLGYAGRVDKSLDYYVQFITVGLIIGL